MEFGTAGLRSVMGAGIARMNIYTVSQTTQGLAELIKRENGQSRGVAIAYDSRNNSSLFAKTAARVLAENGITVYFFDSLRPTPELSFAILHLGCIAGINITASHNPKEYNGYKVYWADGAQLPPEHASIVSAESAKTDVFSVKLADFDKAIDDGIIKIIGAEIDESYLDAVLDCRIYPDILKEYGNSLNLVYTPLHGTGYRLVPEVLKRSGLTNLRVVKSQEQPDGNFPTVTSPNPENKPCFELALKLIKDENLDTDVVIATDPDGDRLGVAIKNENGEFDALSGNQIGAILIDYIIRGRKLQNRLPKNACAIRSIVSSSLFDKICLANDVTPISVLTGFKYIGEKIKEFSASAEQTFIFGYEESQGFLSGGYVRDKDAVAAAMLIAEAASYYKSNKKTLYDALDDIYKTYGYHSESVSNIQIKGALPMLEMKNKMSALRSSFILQIGGTDVVKISDYLSKIATDVKTSKTSPTSLPKSDMIFYELSDGTNIIIRPSGTEPKIKVYIQASGKDKQEVLLKLDKYLANLPI
ncbi:MAG: phospho-sugar mutase, partial [Clostridia bacterium]